MGYVRACHDWHVNGRGLSQADLKYEDISLPIIWRNPRPQDPLDEKDLGPECAVPTAA